MLESIIEYKIFGSVPRENVAIFITIGAHADFYFSRKPFAQERNFIALWLATRIRSRGAAISASQYRSAFPLRGQSFGDPQHHRCFTRAADREVSHTDNCSWQL